MYGEIGSLRWRGDRFNTEGGANGERAVVEGELLPLGAKPPGNMRVRYLFPHQTNDYVLSYGYRALPSHPFLPTVITNFWTGRGRRRGGKRIELDQWRILTMEFADSELPAETFAVASFLRPEWKARVYTNGGIYDVGTNGTLQLDYPIGRLANGGSFRRPILRVSRPAFYAVWACVNVTIFALMLGARESERETNQRERFANMKFSFKPQKAILVAGVAAAAYAQACYYQNTAVLCFQAATTVDRINWYDDHTGISASQTSSPVTATQDWFAYSVSGHYYVGVGPGYTSYTADTSEQNPIGCSGPAQFLDFTGHTISLAWQYNVASGATIGFPNIVSGTVNTGTTCN